MNNVPSSEIASSRLSISGTRNKIIESPFLSYIHTIFKNIFALYNVSQHNDNIQYKINDKSTQGNSTNISRCKCHTSLLSKFACRKFYAECVIIMCQGNCSDSIPPWTSLLFCCPGLLTTLFLPCPALTNHFNPLILESPALFSLNFPVPRPILSHKFFLRSRGCSRGDGGKTI